MRACQQLSNATTAWAGSLRLAAVLAHSPHGAPGVHCAIQGDLQRGYSIRMQDRLVHTVSFLTGLLRTEVVAQHRHVAMPLRLAGELGVCSSLGRTALAPGPLLANAARTQQIMLEVACCCIGRRHVVGRHCCRSSMRHSMPQDGLLTAAAPFACCQTPSRTLPLPPMS
jgi:hypothetical protein